MLAFDRYNHGGGYAYRLCPTDEPLTEACFQAHHLDFDPAKQVLKWNNGTLQYPMGDKAVFVAGNATNPPNSMWARNPIPRIWDSKIGLHNPDACPGPSARAANSPPGCLAFPAPCPWDTYLKDGLFPCTTPPDHESLHKCDGDGMGVCTSDWVVGVVSDHVVLPKDLKPGEYVLSWRWDCEETAQVCQPTFACARLARASHACHSRCPYLSMRGACAHTLMVGITRCGPTARTF